MAQLTGITQDGTEVPVQVKPDGRLVAEGLDGPPGPTGPAGPAGDAQFSASSSESVYLPSPKKLGLGTATPGQILDVVTSGAGRIQYSDGTRSTSIGSTGTLSYVGTGSANLIFTTNGYQAADEKVRIDGSGRVGIGSTSVTRTLDVVGTGIYTAYTGNTGATFNIVPGANGQDGVSFIHSYRSGTGYGPLKFEINGEKARLTADGKLLVGTVNHPQSAVGGSVVCAGGLYLSSPNGSWWQIGVSDTGTLSAVAA